MSSDGNSATWSGGTTGITSTVTTGGPTAGQRRARLEPREEQRLLRSARAGDEDASARLVTAYEPLVAGLAARLRGPGLDEEDLLQEGRIGLLDSISRFDLERGVRLGTAARQWVRWRMEQALAAALPQPLPEREWRLRRRLHAVVARLENVCGAEPSAEAVAAETGLSLTAVRARLEQRLTVQSIEKLSPPDEPAGPMVCGQAEAWQRDECRHRLADVAAQLNRRLGRLPSGPELGAELRLDVEILGDALQGDAEAVRAVLGGLASGSGTPTTSEVSASCPGAQRSAARPMVRTAPAVNAGWPAAA